MYLTDINSFIQSKEAEWVVNGKIDQEWDDYVKRLNDMGMERVREIYQTGADRWPASSAGRLGLTARRVASCVGASGRGGRRRLSVT